ncbi:hypothetical protein C8Q70DRAFT_287605 [Cubamyces menziesii]|nr:hypothetical protein C8Q70DRAFT_287605 [Cubamyces menziesii]
MHSPSTPVCPIFSDGSIRQRWLPEIVQPLAILVGALLEIATFLAAQLQHFGRSTERRSSNALWDVGLMGQNCWQICLIQNLEVCEFSGGGGVVCSASCESQKSSRGVTVGFFVLRDINNVCEAKYGASPGRTPADLRSIQLDFLHGMLRGTARSSATCCSASCNNATLSCSLHTSRYVVHRTSSSQILRFCRSAEARSARLDSHSKQCPVSFGCIKQVTAVQRSQRVCHLP